MPVVRLPDLAQSAFPEIPDHPYDLIVLGSGPAGETAAVRAAQLGQQVAIVEVKKAFGGPTGLTSKAVREATKRILKTVEQIGGNRDRQIRRLWKKRFPALKSEAEVYQAMETRDRLNKNGCDLFIGSAFLVKSPFSDRRISLLGSDLFCCGLSNSSDVVVVRVCRPTGCVELESKYVVIATGSRPARPEELRPGIPIPYTSRRVIDSTQVVLVGVELRDRLDHNYIVLKFLQRMAMSRDQLQDRQTGPTSRCILTPVLSQMANLKELPESIAVIGGGVIGVEYATVLAQLGVACTVMCKESGFLPFLPQELQDAVKEDMWRSGIDFQHEAIKTIEVGEDKIVRIEFENRILVEADVVLYSGGRDANSEKIGCEDVGVKIGRYGRIDVDSDFRTGNKRIYAIGDVIGPPSLASYAQQSARYVADLLFGKDGEARKGGPEITTMGMGQGQQQPEVELEDWADDDFFSPIIEGEAEEEAERQQSMSKLKRLTAPLTLWTFPEIASVGLSVDQAVIDGYKIATPDEGSIVWGYAYYRDLARGRLSGDLNGFLKIIARADREDRHVIIGVHCVGETANELIQLGSVLVHAGTTLEELSNTPFAAVTLTCLYQIASDNALLLSPRNKLQKPAKPTKAGPVLQAR